MERLVMEAIHLLILAAAAAAAIMVAVQVLVA
jgi:hypothetical protein